MPDSDSDSDSSSGIDDVPLGSKAKAAAVHQVDRVSKKARQ